METNKPTKRKSGRSGSASTDPIDGHKITFTLNETAYLVSKAESIERMYRFLTDLYHYYNNTGHRKTLVKLCADHKISYHIITILQHKQITTKDTWTWRNQTMPTKFLAIQAQLWYRNYFTDRKKNIDQIPK